MQFPINIETQEDADWIHWLVSTMVERDERRRGEEKVFSPSALSECMRQVFLFKNHKKFGLERRYLPRMEPNFYFLNGNFLHIKWQFACWKMGNYLDPLDFILEAVEFPVLSKRGDHGGTIDVVCRIDEEPYIVDFKGLNVRAFGKATRNVVDVKYKIQITDYAMLYNASKKRPTEKVEKVLLVIENKGGPDVHHPIALHEVEIDVREHLPEVRRRLEVLRKHEEENSIPEIECTSTRQAQFLGCPFAAVCKKEILQEEKRRRKRRANNRDATKLRIAIPAGRRNNRSKRDSK